jgi:hypothetical protein
LILQEGRRKPSAWYCKSLLPDILDGQDILLIGCPTVQKVRPDPLMEGGSRKKGSRLRSATSRKISSPVLLRRLRGFASENTCGVDGGLSKSDISVANGISFTLTSNKMRQTVAAAQSKKTKSVYQWSQRISEMQR